MLCRLESHINFITMLRNLFISIHDNVIMKNKKQETNKN